MHYYKNRSTEEEYVLYKTIKNGHILTKFNETNGSPITNTHYQLYVQEHILQCEYIEFKYQLPISEKINNLTAVILETIVEQLKKYGIAENQVYNFDEFINVASVNFPIYKAMATENYDTELQDYLPNGAYDVEFEDARDIFNLLTQGVAPKLKQTITKYLEDNL
jgi:hypothetical protein